MKYLVVWHLLSPGPLHQTAARIFVSPSDCYCHHGLPVKENIT